MIEKEAPRAAAVGERVTVVEVAERYISHAERQGRKPSDGANIEMRDPGTPRAVFRRRSLDAITPEDIARPGAVLEGKELAAKTIRNIVATLSALFNFAMAPGAAGRPPIPARASTCPPSPSSDRDPLSDARRGRRACRARPAGSVPVRSTARSSSTAAMTGLRKGELVALRWCDVDWPAGADPRPPELRSRRVRHSRSQGARLARVPMADEVGGELERLFQRSPWQGDGDLVFAHPETGGPLPKATSRAGCGQR